MPAGDRARFISLMASPQPPQVTDDEMGQLFRKPAYAPARAGILVKDYAGGSAQRLIRRAMMYPLWQLSFAAFFLNRFWVSPFDANEAAGRCLATNTGSGNAVWNTYTELRAHYDVTDDEVNDFGASPENVLLRMFGEGAEPSGLTAALWALQLQTANELRQAQDKLRRYEEFIVIDGRAPEGSNDTRGALFLLAKADGLFHGPGLGKAAEELHRRLTQKLDEYQESRTAAGLNPLAYELPTPATLRHWIERGSSYLGEDMRGKPGRPRKPIPPK